MCKTNPQNVASLEPIIERHAKFRVLQGHDPMDAATTLLGEMTPTELRTAGETASARRANVRGAIVALYGKHVLVRTTGGYRLRTKDDPPPPRPRVDTRHRLAPVG